MRPIQPARSLAVALGFFLLSGASWSVDLLQVYREALVNDAQYTAARATAEAGREKLPQGLAGLLPVIGGTANTVWNENKYRVDHAARTGKEYNTNAYNVSLTQPLFRWQNVIQYDQAKWQVVQTEANFAQASQDLVLRVAQAYFDVLNAQENLKAVRATKQSIALQREQARKNFEVGTATITDTHEAQSRYDLASAQELAGENDLEVKRYVLRQIVGKEVGELHRLKTVDRPNVIAAIAEARSHGDLSENAEYDAAKERQGFIEGRIAEIEGKLSNAQIIDPKELDAEGRVVFGATVELEDVEAGKPVTYQIVGDDEADLKAGMISVNSPIARALIGKYAGDVAEVQAPGGIREYEIVDVRYV